MIMAILLLSTLKHLVVNGSVSMNEPVAVVVKPVPKRLSWCRWLLAKSRIGCRYCGKIYRNCYSPSNSLFSPLPNKGKFCPDGHAGYIVFFDPALGFWKEYYDFVARRDS